MKKLIELGIVDKECVNELESLRKEHNLLNRDLGALIRSYLKDKSINQEHFNWMMDQVSDAYKQSSKKQNLIDTFNNAINNNYRFIILDLKIPNSDVYESIIVRNPNFKNKLEYYINAYDDNLVLKTCKDIEIRKVTAAKNILIG